MTENPTPSSTGIRGARAAFTAVAVLVLVVFGFYGAIIGIWM